MNFYSLRSKSLKRYNVPFLARDDENAVEIVSKMVAQQNDAALLSSLDDLELFMIAEFDPSADDDLDQDVIIQCEPYLVLNNLHINLPLPPTIKERLDQFYKVGDQSVE